MRIILLLTLSLISSILSDLDLFNKFIKKYDKKYSISELNYRYNIFKDNINKINESYFGYVQRVLREVQIMKVEEKKKKPFFPKLAGRSCPDRSRNVARVKSPEYHSF